MCKRSVHDFTRFTEFLYRVEKKVTQIFNCNFINTEVTIIIKVELFCCAYLYFVHFSLKLGLSPCNGAVYCLEE